MPASRRRGMDHGLYAFSHQPARAALAWPDGAALACWICVHLEYWELHPPESALHPPGIEGTWQTHAPDYRTFAHREYGNRIGIFRVLDALDEFSLRPTFAVNAEICRRYPALLDACMSRQCEVAAGGTHATRMISSLMDEGEERAYIAESAHAVRLRTGLDARGWIGQDNNESPRTPELVAAQGFKYIADWPNDDQPYWMDTATPLVSMPQQTEWDDVTSLWIRQLTTHRYVEVVLEAFRTLLVEGRASGRCFVLNIHPWLFGQAHRIKYLRDILRNIASSSEVWHATASEIADCFGEHNKPAGNG